MSCLYSSPEVTNLGVKKSGKNLGLWLPSIVVAMNSGCHGRGHDPPARSGTRDTHRIAAQLNFTPIFAVRRSQQRRVPQQPSVRSRLHQVIPPAKTSTGFSREFSSAISGFRSLCGRKQRSSLSHRAQLDLRFGTFHSGRALALRTLASTRHIPKGYLPGVSTGPATLDRCCGRNVVAPGEYSKWFFRALSGHFAARHRPLDACQIGFGRPLKR
jgi:hypothetical protein